MAGHPGNAHVGVVYAARSGSNDNALDPASVSGAFYDYDCLAGVVLPVDSFGSEQTLCQLKHVWYVADEGNTTMTLQPGHLDTGKLDAAVRLGTERKPTVRYESIHLTLTGFGSATTQKYTDECACLLDTVRSRAAVASGTFGSLTLGDTAGENQATTIYRDTYYVKVS